MKIQVKIFTAIFVFKEVQSFLNENIENILLTVVHDDKIQYCGIYKKVELGEVVKVNESEFYIYCTFERVKLIENLSSRQQLEKFHFIKFSNKL